MRVTPLTGTDTARRFTAENGLLREGEIHTTLDQGRTFFQNEIIAPRFHGEVADETALLALNDTSEHGCFRGDMAVRLDTSTVWLCIANNGELITEWYELTFTVGDLITIIDGGDATAPADDLDGGAAGDEFSDIVDGSDDPGF